MLWWLFSHPGSKLIFNMKKKRNETTDFVVSVFFCIYVHRKIYDKCVNQIQLFRVYIWKNAIETKINKNESKLCWSKNAAEKLHNKDLFSRYSWTLISWNSGNMKRVWQESVPQQRQERRREKNKISNATKLGKKKYESIILLYT